ncbi:hypothetical protein [Streptomyces sp. NPDC002790]|uniref:hypothetical protein n=1 Tax=Streptomyces sp. NPDC002790 TaxID=3154431 RepID=UPI003326A9AD
MINRRRAALSCASLLLASGTLAATGSVAAAETASGSAAGKAARLTVEPTSQATCNYRGYDKSGAIFEAWKGNGLQDIGGGRSLGLATGQDNVFVDGDRSSAHLEKAQKGDSAWVEILTQEDRPESWRSGVPCGITSERHPRATNPGAPKRYYIRTQWYWHSGPTVHDRWMRACAEMSGDVKCGKWYDDHIH